MDDSLMESGKNIAMKGVTSREKRYFIIIILLSILLTLSTLGLILSFFVQSMKPDNTIVVEAETGKILGSYRTTAYRTDSDIIGATKKFIQCEMSWNADTVYSDFACALSMMKKDSDLYKRRLAYIQKENLAQRIIDAGTTSKVSSVTINIVDRKHDLVYAEATGIITIKGVNEVVPFSQDITWRQVPITFGNTSGVEMVTREEYTLINAFDLIDSKES